MVHSKKHERTCLCGNKYNYCPQCDEYKHMEPWHLVYCSENCKDIDIILSNWGAGVIDSDTARTLLKTKDLSRIEFWNDNFKAAYYNIMGNGCKNDESKNSEPESEDSTQDKPLSVSEELKKHESKGHMQPKSRVKKNSK